MKRTIASLMIFAVAAMLSAGLVVPASAENSEETPSAIDALVTSVLDDIGFKNQVQELLEMDINQKVEGELRGLMPIDNFNLGEPGIDTSSIRPTAIVIGRFEPFAQLPANDLLDAALAAAMQLEDMTPSEVLTDEGAEAIWKSWTNGDGYSQLVLDGFADSNDRFDPLRPDPTNIPGYDRLTDEAAAGIDNFVATDWDGGIPVSPFLRDATFGEGAPLGCGPHDGYEVRCDPSDPGGSQFSSSTPFVAIQLPQPIDAMGQPYEVEVVFRFNHGPSPTYQGSFQGDLFNGSNYNYVSRPAPAQQFEALRFMDNQWAPWATHSRIVDMGDVQILLLDTEHDFESFGVATFLSTGVRQQGQVGSYALPATTEPLLDFEPMGWLPPIEFEPFEVELTEDMFLSTADGVSPFKPIEPEVPEIDEPDVIDPEPVEEIAVPPTDTTEDAAETIEPEPEAESDSSGSSTTRNVIIGVALLGLAVAAGILARRR